MQAGPDEGCPVCRQGKLRLSTYRGPVDVLHVMLHHHPPLWRADWAFTILKPNDKVFLEVEGHRLRSISENACKIDGYSACGARGGRGGGGHQPSGHNIEVPYASQ